MNAERWQQVEREGAMVDLSNRAKWRLSGSDRIRYLNGQVTNDVRRTMDGKVVYACVTDLKGKIAADVFIRTALGSDSLWIDAEPELREVLGARLERYIIADDCELTDVTEDWGLLHRFFAEGDDITTDAPVVNRFGRPGIDVWLPAGTPAPEPEGVPWLDAGDLEFWRVIAGVPKYPNELNADTFPPEAGIEARAMDYAKGCYIGQEILSRIRTTGKMPRQLIHIHTAVDGTPFDVGDCLFVSDVAESPKQVGTVTSAVLHPLSGLSIGLGFVKQGSLPVDSRLLVGKDVTRIRGMVSTNLISPR